MKELYTNLDLIRNIFTYSPETGKLYWKITPSKRIRVNQEAGYIQRKGQGRFYRVVRFNGVNYQAHRLIWILYYGSLPENFIDHIDGDGLNNKIDNLRSVTLSENSRNMKKSSRNTSGVVGVKFCKTSSRWHATIFNKKTEFIGSFSTKDEAIIARKQREQQLNYHNNHGR